MKDILDWITQNSIWLGPIAGSIATWFGKRAYDKIQLNKERKSYESDALGVLEKNVGIYQTIIDDLDKRFNQRIKNLDEYIAKLEQINDELIVIIKQKEEVIKEQQEIIEKQKTEISALQNAKI